MVPISGRRAEEAETAPSLNDSRWGPAECAVHPGLRHRGSVKDLTSPKVKRATDMRGGAPHTQFYVHQSVTVVSVNSYVL